MSEIYRLMDLLSVQTPTVVSALRYRYDLCSYWDRVTGRDKVTLLHISLVAPVTYFGRVSRYKTKESKH